jgi:methylaspartate ammonia-lyase
VPAIKQKLTGSSRVRGSTNSARLANSLEAVAKAPIKAKIVASHHCRRKAFLEDFTDAASVDVGKLRDGRQGFIFAVHDITGFALVDDFRNRSAAPNAAAT